KAAGKVPANVTGSIVFNNFFQLHFRIRKDRYPAAICELGTKGIITTSFNAHVRGKNLISNLRKPGKMCSFTVAGKIYDVYLPFVHNFYRLSIYSVPRSIFIPTTRNPHH